MSHVTKVNLRVKDLDALAEAGSALGLELKRDQKNFKWFGKFMGDSTPPKGLATHDYGKCLHALALKDPKPNDYEIGVVKALDGTDGFDLVVDTWCQQRLMTAVGGHQMNGLRREYAAAVTLKKANATLQRKGFVATRTNLANGAIQLRLRKR